MTGEFGNVDKGGASHKLLGDKSVAKIVDLGGLDTGEGEETVDTGADVSDQEGVAGLGDEDVFGSTLGALDEVSLQGGFGGGIERNLALRMGLVGFDSDFVAGEVEVGHGQIGELGDTHAGLKKKLDDGGDALIGATGVTEGAVFKLAEDSGRLQVVLGMADASGGVDVDQILALEEAEKGFDGVELATDGLGGVLLAVEVGFEGVNIFGGN